MGFRTWSREARDTSRVVLTTLLAVILMGVLAQAAEGVYAPARMEPLTFLPLPVFATLPNEGPTYGVMPVFLGYDERQKDRINSIAAPSLTWNRVSHITTTGRYFQYPDEFEERVFQATYGTRVFREVIADLFRREPKQGKLTYVASFQYRADPYRRFFGFGKDTAQSDQTSYTLEGVKTFARVGYNFTDDLNAGLMLGFDYQKPRNIGVLGIKSIFELPQSIPGLSGATATFSAVHLRFDNRPLREYSTHGLLAEASVGGVVSNVAKGGIFGTSRAEVRYLWEETARLNGAMRANWKKVYGADVPFFERPSLGGSFYQRGHFPDRFVDNGAWTLEIEQRITTMVLHIEGSVVEFSLDPFVTVGQVYSAATEFFDRPQLTEGIGFRAISRPSVVGRVDIARDESQFNVYVELGYPF